MITSFDQYDNNNIFLLQNSSITYKNSLIFNHYFSIHYKFVYAPRRHIRNLISNVFTERSFNDYICIIKYASARERGGRSDDSR